MTFSVLRATNTRGEANEEFKKSLIEARCQEMGEIFQDLREMSSEEPHKTALERGVNVANIKAELERIFDKAIQFSSILKTQRAAFDLIYPDIGPPMTVDVQGAPKVIPRAMNLQPDWMDVDDPEDHNTMSIVDFIVEPALFKCGNANGEKYEMNAGCFMKAKVVCLNLPKPM